MNLFSGNRLLFVTLWERTNPPLHVIEGFVQHIWNAEDIDKIGLAGKGVFLVRMKTIEGMIAAYGSSGMLFDKKPFIVKPWTKNASFENETLNYISIWVLSRSWETLLG